MEWFLKAAKQGIVEAQYEVGKMYDDGLGVPTLSAMAKEWYLQAAEKGYPQAQFRIGRLYCLGRGVEKRD